MAENFFPGSPEPFDYPEFLSRNWRKPGFLYASLIIFDLEVAKDIVSDALYKILEEKPEFTSTNHARTYFFIKIKNLCIDHILTHAPDPLDFPIVSSESAFAHMEAIEKALNYQQLKAKLFRCLTKTERKIVIMAIERDMSNLEIAQNLGTSMEGIRARKSAALKKIRDNFPQYKRY